MSDDPNAGHWSRQMLELRAERDRLRDSLSDALVQASADLDKIAALRAERDRLRENRDYWMKAAQEAQGHRDGANLQLGLIHADLAEARGMLEVIANQDIALLADYDALTAERDRLAAELTEQVQTTARIASERACLEVENHALTAKAREPKPLPISLWRRITNRFPLLRFPAGH